MFKTMFSPISFKSLAMPTVTHTKFTAKPLFGKQQDEDAFSKASGSRATASVLPAHVLQAAKQVKSTQTQSPVENALFQAKYLEGQMHFAESQRILQEALDALGNQASLDAAALHLALGKSIFKEHQNEVLAFRENKTAFLHLKTALQMLDSLIQTTQSQDALAKALALYQEALDPMIQHASNVVGRQEERRLLRQRIELNTILLGESDPSVAEDHRNLGLIASILSYDLPEDQREPLFLEAEAEYKKSLAGYRAFAQQYPSLGREVMRPLHNLVEIQRRLKKFDEAEQNQLALLDICRAFNLKDDFEEYILREIRRKQPD